MDNPFKKIFSNIENFVGGAKDNAVGVDVGSSAIKVVEIKRKGGKAILETYGAIALGPYDNLDAGAITNLPVEKVSEALKEVLKQSDVTAVSAAFSIPVQSSLIFSIELPSQVKENEIAEIISTEARKYIPVPITEVSLDYFKLPQKEPSFLEMNSSDLQPVSNAKVNVLVVATQNDAISRYRSIVSQSNLSASFFEI